MFDHHEVSVHEFGSSQHVAALFDNSFSIGIDVTKILSDPCEPVILGNAIQVHRALGEFLKNVNELFPLMQVKPFILSEVDVLFNCLFCLNPRNSRSRDMNSINLNCVRVCCS